MEQYGNLMLWTKISLLGLPWDTYLYTYLYICLSKVPTLYPVDNNVNR